MGYHGDFSNKRRECGVDSEKQRRVLHELQKSGEYIFHGSSVPGIGELEPRQPYDYTGGEKKPHGNPSVVGTPYADIAIFRSLVYTDSTGFGSDDEGNLSFSASKIAMNDAREKVGYVYVLPRRDFRPMRGGEMEMDWRAELSQTPARIVKVTFDDLPDGIQMIEF